MQMAKKVEGTCTLPGTSRGTDKKEKDQIIKQWQDLWTDEMKNEENQLDSKKYGLGMVGKHSLLRSITNDIKEGNLEVDCNPHKWKNDGEGRETTSNVHADHIPPKCVFKNLYKDPFYKVAKWCHDHEDDDLKKLVDESLDTTIKKIINAQDVKVNDYEMCKNVFDKLRQDYAKEEGNSKDLKEHKNNTQQVDFMTRKIAIELCIKKNEYEKMILERMRLETDENKEKKLKEIKTKIMEKEEQKKKKKVNVTETETEEKTLYDLVCQNGDNGACRNVLEKHHEKGLTYRHTKYSITISKILQTALLAGDGVKLIKWSLMVANPEVSTYIKQELKKKGAAKTPKRTPGGQIENTSTTGMSGTKPCNTPDNSANTEQEPQQGGKGTNDENIKQKADKETMTYHGIGDKLLVEYYSKFITQDEKNKLDDWLKKWNLEEYQIETDEEIPKILDELIKGLKLGEQNNVQT